MKDYLKSERVLKGSLCNMFTVLMALCNTEDKDQVKALPKYNDMDKKLDLMTLLKAIKKMVYTGGSDNRLAKHNRAMTHISFMGLQQERYQDIQDFREQYRA